MSLIPPDKHKVKIENIIAPRTALEFTAFVGLTVLISLLTAGNIFGMGGVDLVGFVWWRVERQSAKERVRNLRNVGAIIAKEAPTGVRGLILLLSPYSPRKPQLKNESTVAPLFESVINAEIEKLTQEDFDKLDLFNSNLFPQIKAVEFHASQGKLRDIWMISTKSYETKKGKKVKGSEDSAQILSQYLQFQYGKSFDINWQRLSVIDYDYKGLCELAEKIFGDSGYKDDVIVADITGGTKMMSVALAMACIPPKRRMQYMDSQRDWEGNPLPAGDMQQIVIDVDPILYSS
jgi:CRISPR-associated protein (Cas_Cas02710).